MGAFTRLAVVPTIVIMLVAISKDGFWKMAHESRTDFAMLLGSIFLLIVGAGSLSFDRVWANRGVDERR